MTNNNFYIQYHNADKLEYFPTPGIDFNSLISSITLNDTIDKRDWIYTTKKTAKQAIGGIYFLIVGKTENRIKNYYLWCHFEIEDCTENFNEIIVNGSGQDLKHPILLNNHPDFDSFKKFCGNFGIGFQNINNHPFLNTLKSYIIEIKRNNENLIQEDTTLKKELLYKLNEEMLSIEPERRVQEIEKILRKDKKIVNLLKELVDYKCQFPNCDSNILTKDGITYVEVAHIKPVSKGGHSILGNLLVLCPNHHKEFDLGKLEIIEQNEYAIVGILNEKNFNIDLSNNYTYKVQ